MPCLWGRHNNSQVFLTVGIIDAGVVKITGTGRFGASAPLPHMFQALLDTGAQRTMISTNVVNTLNLTPVGSIPLQGVGDKVTYHNGYLFHVAFVFPVTSLIPGTATSRAIYSNLKPIYGGELTSTGGVFDVLLGMDIISSGSLKVDGDGTFSFSI